MSVGVWVRVWMCVCVCAHVCRWVCEIIKEADLGLCIEDAPRCVWGCVCMRVCEIIKEVGLGLCTEDPPRCVGCVCGGVCMSVGVCVHRGSTQVISSTAQLVPHCRSLPLTALFASSLPLQPRRGCAMHL